MALFGINGHAVANYRQTVLTGFQRVEDNVAALWILEHAAQVQDNAAATAQKYLELAIKRDKGGVIGYKPDSRIGFARAISAKISI